MGVRKEIKMKDQTTEFLVGLKIVLIVSRDFAQSRIDKMENFESLNSPGALNEFIIQRKQANNKLGELEKCINWLEKLE